MASLHLDDYDYDLPERLIAHAPAAERAQSSLMLVHDDQRRSTVPFASLTQTVEAGDLLVLNDTRVVPSRVSRQRASGGQVEVFVLGPTRGDWREGPGLVPVHILVRPGRRLRPGQSLGDVTQVIDIPEAENTEL